MYKRQLLYFRLREMTDWGDSGSVSIFSNLASIRDCTYLQVGKHMDSDMVNIILSSSDNPESASPWKLII